jgi:hypothetical protein
MNKPFARVTLLALLAGGLLAMTADTADAGRRRCRRFACCHTSHCSHSHDCCASQDFGCSTGCGATCCGYSQGGGCCATGSGCNVAGTYVQDGSYQTQEQYTSQPTPYHSSTPTEYYTEPVPESQPRSSNPVQSEQQSIPSDQGPAA